MGRVTYKVKNTFVEFGAPVEDHECRGRRAWSGDLIAQDAQGREQPQYNTLELEAPENFVPATPSPLMHPAMLPLGAEEMMSFCVDSTLPPTAFDAAAVEGFQDMQEMCIPAVAYDPSSGWCSGWCMQLPDAGGYSSMGCQEIGDLSHWEYMGQDGLEAVPDMGDYQEFQELQECGDMQDHMLQQQHESELQQPFDEQAAFQEACQEAIPGGDPEGSQGSDERPEDSAWREDCAWREDGAWGEDGAWVEDGAWGREDESSGRSGGSRAWGKASAKLGTYTTVMLRNVPNKYTREMLVDQLSRDFKGLFDFVYLPIDFKNGCNIGYGFINFRTVEACAEFVTAFDGVDVSRCLPGLHSRKVAEVTPARVQGLEENVRRLRGSPVMGELSRHPEWMPLLMGEDGQERPFPQPEQPVPPVRPRSRRSREAWSDRPERGGERGSEGGGRSRGGWRR